MTAAAGFVRALQDDPSDETVREIFSDWLEEQGDAASLARGRLLRLQTELGRWVPELERRRDLLDEEQRLLAEHAPEWLRPLGGFARRPRFRDGLVDVVFAADEFLSPAFAAAAEEVFDTGWVGEVRLDRLPPHLGACPVLARVRQLDLSGLGLDDADLHELLASPHLAGLVRLDLRNNRLSAVGVRAVLATAALPALHLLEVHGNPVAGELLQEVHAFNVARGGIATREGLPTRLVNAAGIELVLVPAGEFLMGSPDSEVEHASSEGPQHAVELTQPFYLGRFPVTQRQYAAVTGRNPAHFTAGNRGGLDHPVEMVTWSEARSYCEQLSALEAEALSGRVYRLPTEAQWEYACRAGTFTPFSFGTTASADDANFDGDHPYGPVPRRSGPNRTSIVGAYRPNALGLFDLHGNVWEWCGDYYHERYYARSPRRNPTGPRSGTRVAARGGSWASHGGICRSASRDYWYGPDYCRDNIGFRVCLTVESLLR